MSDQTKPTDPDLERIKSIIGENFFYSTLIADMRVSLADEIHRRIAELEKKFQEL